MEHRVFGPPGTGKTTFLSKEVEKACSHFDRHSVMVCSFTTSAAEEVVSRVPDMPESNIGTLHKFCYEAIGRPQLVEGKRKYIDEWNEFEPAYKMAGTKKTDLDSFGSVTLGDRLLYHSTILRNKMIPIERWPENLRKFYESWRQWKQSISVIDYTDMLEHALETTQSPMCRPEIIFVDEAQDCTALQFAVLQKWSKLSQKLIMVGDDDQCIYQFAGATPEAFACSEIGKNDRLLSQSYRIPARVHEFAMKWIEKVPDRVKKPYKPVPDKKGFVKKLPYSWKQADYIVNTIWESIQQFDSVMVIGACSFMIDPIKNSLLKAGIPFHNPYRTVRGDWNPLKVGNGTSFAQRVTSFLSPLIYDKKMWSVQELRDFASVLSAKTVFKKGMKSKLDTDSISSVDLDVMFKYFEEDALHRLLALDLDFWTNNLVNEEARRKAQYPRAVIDKFGHSFLDTDIMTPYVTIGTIHSVKGGEADIVILLPDLSQDGMAEWEGEGRSSIRRLMYVGITRAKHGVYICKPASQMTCDLYN